MKNLSNKYIIKTLFNKHLLESTKNLFWFWLRISKESPENKEALEEIWDECPNDITSKTYRDYLNTINKINQSKKPKLVIALNYFRRYAAIIAIIFVSIALTYYFASPGKDALTPPEYTELYAENGITKHLILSDGSKVTVFPGSILIYPKKFYGNKRIIYLNGRARFQVAKNHEKPFTVNTSSLNITALGTVFSVEAYSNSSKIIALLEEGCIKVGTKDKTPRYEILKPLQRVTYIRKTGAFINEMVNKIEMKEISKGALVFDNSTFDEIIKALEYRYGVEFVYDTSKFKNHRYNIKFMSDENLYSALQIMSKLINDFTYDKQAKIVTIK